MSFLGTFAALGTIVILLGGLAGPALRRGAWTRRLPRVAVTAWLGALAGTLTAMIGVVALVSTGRNGLIHRTAERLADCWHDHGRAGVPFSAFNAALLALTAAAALVIVVRCRRTVAQRRRHREALGFIASAPGDLDDVCVIDHPVPVVYCLPARNRPIVVSSGALDRLERPQLQAVLAHERVHLRHHHHLLLTLVDALATALGWLPTFRDARLGLPILLEMTADDDAALAWGRQTVAAALRELAVLPSPAGGLAAGASDSSDLRSRLLRLEGTGLPSGVWHRRLTRAAAAAAVAVPTLISAGWLSATPLFC